MFHVFIFIWVGCMSFLIGRLEGERILLSEVMKGEYCRQVELPGENIKKCYKLVEVKK